MFRRASGGDRFARVFLGLALAALVFFQGHVAAAKRPHRAPKPKPSTTNSHSEEQRLRSLALNASAHGQFDDAVHFFERAAKADSARSTTLKDLADALDKDAKPDESLRVYREYLRRVPGDDQARLAVAALLARSADETNRAEADQELTAFLAAHPSDSGALFARASVRASLGRAAEAVTDTRAYLVNQPDDGGTLLQLARQVEILGQPADIRAVISLLDAYVSRHPTDVNARAEREHAGEELADALAKSPEKRERLEALAIYSAYLKQFPQDRVTLAKRAHLLLSLGRTDEAENDLRVYAQEDASGVGALELAGAMCADHKLAEAIPFYDRYLASHPEDIDARIHRAQAVFGSGDLDEAETELEALSRMAKTDAQRNAIDVQLANIFASTGRPFLATDQLDELLARDPANVNAQKARHEIGASLGSQIKPKFLTFYDDTGARMTMVGADGRAALSSHLALLAEVEAWTANGYRTGRANAGVWWRYKTLELEGVAGPRIYESRSPHAGGRATLRAIPLVWLRTDLTYRDDDVFFDIIQPTALPADVHGHSLYSSTFGEYGRFSFFARAGVRDVVPDNQLVDSFVTLQLRILGPLRIGYAGAFYSWKRPDPAYWSPQLAIENDAVVHIVQPIGKLTVDVQAWVGMNGGRAVGADAPFTPDYGGIATLSWTIGPLDLRANTLYVHIEHFGFIYYLTMTGASVAVHF